MKAEMSESQQRVKEMASELFGIQTTKGHEDFIQRPLVATFYGGHYGHAAGCVIAVQGSPPKGTFVVQFLDGGDIDNAHCFYLCGGRSRKIGDNQSKTLREYVKELRAEKDKPVDE